MSATQYFFRTPFATSGDVLAIPVPVQGGGEVSFTQGFGSDYSLPNANPSSKKVPRDQTNQLYFWITQAIAQYQTFGAPEWIAAADNNGVDFPYEKNATVKYTDGDVYVSLVAANTALPTDVTKWNKRATIVGLPFIVADVSGTPNALVAIFSPAVTVATQVVGYIVQALSPNSSTAVTLKPNGLAALPVLINNGQLPYVGAIAGAGHECMFTYNATLNSYMLMNPAPAAAAISTSETTAAQSPVSATNTMTFTHSLGVRPKMIQAYIRVKAGQTDNGYVAGDTLPVFPCAVGGFASNFSMVVPNSAPTTTVKCATSSGGFYTINQSSWTNASITPSKWEMFLVVFS